MTVYKWPVIKPFFLSTDEIGYRLSVNDSGIEIVYVLKTEHRNIRVYNNENHCVGTFNRQLKIYMIFIKRY